MLASGNAGKLREFSELLAATGLALVAQSAFGIEPPPETGTTFVENALIKARNAARHPGLPAIADDSGIEVDALGGAPGVYSARYAGEHASDEANLASCSRRSTGVPPRTAHRALSVRRSCIVRGADDPHPLIGEGTWEGDIIAERRAAGGFGYDPSSCPRRHAHRRGAAGGREERVSHRGQALRALSRANSRERAR